MAKKSTKPKGKTKILEVIDVLEESGNWSKCLIKVSWFGGPPQLDIRNIKMDTINDDEPVIGKGIALTDSGVKRLANKLVELGYVDIDTINECRQDTIDLFNMFSDDNDDEERTILHLRKKKKK